MLMLWGGMKKGEWSLEQATILQAREVDDFILNAILLRAIKRMEDNPYCRQILENAGYYATSRPDKFDAQGFHLEKIYIGHSNSISGVQGHCTKESFQYMNKKEENEGLERNVTRDAVYINEKLVESIAIGTLKDIMQVDITVLYEDIKLKLQERLEQNKKFREKFLDMASSELVCYIAHECLHGNQMNQGLNNGAQCSRSIYSTQDINREKEFYFGRDETGNFRTKIAGEHSPYQKWLSGLAKEGKLVDAYGVDSIDEAGVMAPAYVAFLEMSPSSGAFSRVNVMYNSRLPEGLSMDYLYKEFLGNVGKYEKGNRVHQQKLSCMIFKHLLKGFGEKSRQKAHRHDVEAGIVKDKSAYKVNYNDERLVKALKYSYRPEFFGSVEAYVEAVSEKLSDKNISFLQQRNNNKLSVAVLNKDKSTER